MSRSFNLLKSVSETGDRVRYFIDGVRVTKDRYELTEIANKNWSNLITIRRNKLGRWLHRKTVS